jgi:hypothetical protein
MMPSDYMGMSKGDECSHGIKLSEQCPACNILLRRQDENEKLKNCLKKFVSIDPFDYSGGGLAGDFITCTLCNAQSSTQRKPVHKKDCPYGEAKKLLKEC